MLERNASDCIARFVFVPAGDCGVTAIKVSYRYPVGLTCPAGLVIE